MRHVGLCFLAFLAACEGGGPSVLVDVQTDWIPGAEMVIVRALLFDADGGEPLEDRSTSVSGTDEDRRLFAEGRRIAELSDVAAGEYRITVEALGREGRLLGSRSVRFPVASDDVGVRVTLTRSCERVSCPPVGAPALTECLGGACTDPRCQPSALEFCPTPACSSDADCDSNACAEGVCSVEGQCLAPGALEGCASGEYCDPVAGCVPIPVSTDGGTPDGGVTDGGTPTGSIVAMDVGDLGTCVVRDDGSVACWGQNRAGQYGTGSTGDQLSPVSMMGIDDAVGVSLGHELTFETGDAHVCVLRAGGVVSCVGHNHRGQLGDGTTSGRTTPVEAFPGLLTDAVQVEAGGGHTCARRSGGQVSCWGLNNLGQLGDGSTDDRGGALVDAMVTGARDVAAGNTFTCVLTASDVRCFGENGGGQHGIGNNARVPGPSVVMGIDGSRVTDIDSSRHTTCATLDDGSVMCWGQDNGLLTHDEPPEERWETARVLEGASGALGIVMGHTSGCYRTAGGAACFGKNDNAQTFPDEPSDRYAPMALTLGAGPLRTPGPGRFHGCAVLESDRVACWGRNYWGLVGNGRTSTSVVSPAVVALP